MLRSFRSAVAVIQGSIAFEMTCSHRNAASHAESHGSSAFRNEMSCSVGARQACFLGGWTLHLLTAPAAGDEKALGSAMACPFCSLPHTLYVWPASACTAF